MDGIVIQIDNVTIESMTITGPPTVPTLRWHVGPVQQKGSVAMPVDVTMSTEEKVRLAVTPQTPGGDPASIDGEAVWSVEGTCTLEPIDATSTWVVAGVVGESTVTVLCDADLGSGVVHLADTCLVQVGTPMAANLGLAADAPVLKTA